MNDFMLLVGAPLSFLLLYGSYCFLLLPALFQYFTFFFFSPGTLLPTCELPLSPSLSVRFPFLRLSFLTGPPLRSFYLTHTVIVKPRAQLLRSVPPPFSMWFCEKTREPRLRMHRTVFFFFFFFFFCQKHNSEPLDTNTLEEHFFFCWHTFIWHVAPLMVLVELNWGQSVGTASGVRMGVKSIKVIWQTMYIVAFVTLSAGAQQKAASDIHFRSFVRLALAASTPMWWRDGSASVSAEHSGLIWVAVFGLAGVTAELMLLLLLL